MPLHEKIIILSGKYRIRLLLGEGGMARVWLAEEPKFAARLVAIKEPKRFAIGFSQSELERRFRLEIEIAERLREHHARHVVLAYTVEEYEGTQLLVMPYMAGGSLAGKLKEFPEGLPWQEAVRIASHVLEGLQTLHEQGIVHRDVKPSNILFDNRGEAHLADFGVAQVPGGTVGRSVMLGGPHPGDPAYAAPEQMRDDGGYLTPAADIYALGATLFEAMTGQRYNLVKPERVSDFREDVPPWLDELIARAVAENPRDRWRDGGEMLAALEKGVDADRQAQIEAANRAEKARRAEEERKRREAEERWQREAERKRGADSGSRVVGDAGGGARGGGEAGGESGRGQREGGGLKKGLWAVLGALAALVLAIGFFFIINGRGGEKDTTPVPLATATPAPQTSAEKVKTSPPPTATPLPPTATSIPPTNTPTPTPTLGIGSTMVSEKDGMEMVYVPAGEFLMGSPEGEGDEDEHPQHKVYLDAYWIDKTEVTKRMFSMFLRETNPNVKIDESDLDYPAIIVNWQDAAAYCRWAGKRLPTEAEWEKAAGGLDHSIYPWGNRFVGTKLNYCDINCTQSWADTEYDDGFVFSAPVGSYPEGQSDYRALDMAGNVFEWVSDWYDEDYYSVSPLKNPLGPDNGTMKVVRGGSWYDNRDYQLTSRRSFFNPIGIGYNIGFRCVMSAVP